MKRILYYLLLLTTILTGCSYKQEIQYSSMTDRKTQDEIKDILLQNNIPIQNITDFFEYVDEFNKESYNGYDVNGYVTAELNSISYNSFTIQENMRHWEALGFTESDQDINCRIAAFTLMQNSFDYVNNGEKADDIIDLEIIKSHYKLDFNNESIMKYGALFNSIPVDGVLGREEAVKAILSNWKKQGVLFKKDESIKLLCVYIQNPDSNLLQVGHAAVLLEIDDGFLLLEKYNPQHPYLATVFEDIESVIIYLNQRMNTAKIESLSNYLIMMNDDCIN